MGYARLFLSPHRRTRIQIPYVHTFASPSPPCPSNTFGNQPCARKSTLISPVRPSVTSTPSASRASRCRCAPSVPGPRELIAPEEATTLCQGTGGSMLGDNHFSARTHSGSVKPRRTVRSVVRNVNLAQRDESRWVCRQASRYALWV